MNPLAQWFHRNAQMTTARPAGRRPATTRRQSLRFKPRVNALEDRCLLSVESIDGTGNNLANPDWGSAGTDLIRMSPVAYADGISSPSLPHDQSARAISNILNNQADPNNPSQDLNTVDQQSLSDFGYAFGQFIDHDMDLTPDGRTHSFPIARRRRAIPIGSRTPCPSPGPCSTRAPAPAPATRASRSTPSPRTSTCRRSTARTKRRPTPSAPMSAAS